VKKLHPSMRRFRSGFTLLEVLFTVLIVAILAAVAVPLYQSSKTTSETTVCKSNIQAIATAESKYKFDNNAYLTGATVAALSTGGIAPATGLLAEGLAAIPSCPTGGAYTVVTAGTGITISCNIATHAANSMTMP
jgi:type IV pilus assembly protein PilE